MAQNINLFEHSPAPQSAARVGWRRAAIAAVLIAAATGTIAALQWRALDNAHTELARLRAEAQRLQREQIEAATPDPALVARIAQEERDVDALEVIARQLTNGSVGRTQGFADELRAFGRATAPGIWFTGMRLDHTTDSMTLDGKAVDASRLPALLHALEAEPHFAGTRFASIELHSSETDASGFPRSLAFRIATPVSDLLVDAGKDAVRGSPAALAPVGVGR
jgi:type IV pilus assembly PilN-like protein